MTQIIIYHIIMIQLIICLYVLGFSPEKYLLMVGSCTWAYWIALASGWTIIESTII